MTVALGTALAVVHASGILGPLQGVTFVLLGMAAIVSTIVGVRRHRPALRWPWALICGALTLFVVGGAAREGLQTLGNISSDRSIVPDLITLPGYVLLGVGLTGLAGPRRREAAGDFDAILDGAIAALASMTLAWVYLINPALSQEHAPLSVRLLLACYPPMSVFLVAITTRIAFTSGARQTPAYRFLVAASVFMLLGDVVYMLVDARLVQLHRSLVDLPYVVAYVAFAANVLDPSMRKLSEPAGRDQISLTRGRLSLVAVALGIPALVTVAKRTSSASDRVVLATITLALATTAIWRVVRALAARANSEARLAHQATHDGLTGLPNRVVVRDHVFGALKAARASGTHVALVFLDVDRFKLINDTFGHTRGDELLVAVARRLEETVRDGDVVARIGGDEFVIVMSDLVGATEAALLAEGLRMSFEVPFTVCDSDVYSSASLGVSIADGKDPTVDSETMIRDADTAMYEAKDAGRNNVSVFDCSMRRRIGERLELERDLRRALERHQLHLAFQPIVHYPTRTVRDMEVLVRWRHPERGEIPPGRFIPIAEDSGLIVEIGSWVLRETCHLLAQWRRHLPLARDLRIAVNLSSRQVRDKTLGEAVHQALEESVLPGEALYLEITESLLMEEPLASAAVLTKLKGLGVGLSIDDFGTGYSSLAYLRRFPVDRVKIDRTFVYDLQLEDTAEASLIAAIVAMTRALGMTTVAEGVETRLQDARLNDLGCGGAQGYLYSPPVAPDEVPATLVRLSLGSGPPFTARTREEASAPRY
ncbi:MAG TPA: EAL domain-containing protein [Acidimicrobiales bacterium]|nr:EAL domain-containing protein [Acidimicrobiales bacterium]